MTDPTRPKGPKSLLSPIKRAALGRPRQQLTLVPRLRPRASGAHRRSRSPGNASTGLGIEPSERDFTTYDLLLDDVALEDVILDTETEGMGIIPATVDLSSADIELISNEKRSFLLHDALRQPAMDAFGWDYVLIDCPPSLNLLTVNAMIASHSVLIPLQSEFLPLKPVAADADGPGGAPNRKSRPENRGRGVDDV